MTPFLTVKMVIFSSAVDLIIIEVFVPVGMCLCGCYREV